MMWPYIVMDMLFTFWLKNQAKQGEEGLGDRAQRVPLSINFRPVYYLNPGAESPVKAQESSFF